MKKNKDKILIFFQSSIDLVDILELVKKYPFGSCFIVITGPKELLHALKKLKIKKKFGTKIYNFSALSLKNPINFLKMYFRFRLSEDSKSLLKYSYKEAFIFNQHEDFVAPIFLDQCEIIKINHIVVYQGNQYKKINKKFPLKNQTRINFKYKLKIFLINILFYNLNIKIFLQKNKFYELIYFSLKKKINIILPTNKKISLLPLFIKKKDKRKKLLYIDSNEKFLSLERFEYVTKKILKISEINGFQIIIKKHVKEKLSTSLNNCKNFIYLNDPIPIELYDLRDIDIIVGLSSAALARIAEKYPNKQSISTINLLLSKKLSNKIMLEFASICKKNKMMYPSSIEQFKNMIEKK